MFAKMSPKFVKSGFMLGLGETRREVLELLSALRRVNCDALTIGQYLAPGLDKAPVHEYIHPAVFKQWEEEARSMGFSFVQAGGFHGGDEAVSVRLEIGQPRINGDMLVVVRPVNNLNTASTTSAIARAQKPVEMKMARACGLPPTP